MSSGTMATYGKLYGVGVGPGDPELLTLKALRVLQQVPVICVPLADDSPESYVYNIVRDFIEPARLQEILEFAFPADDAANARQVWEAAAAAIVERLRKGKDVAFITEGDPLVYSTFPYVVDEVRARFPLARVETVPGVSSVIAAAASVGAPLVAHGQRLAVLPSVNGIDDLRNAISHYDTVVLMEVNRYLLQSIANLEKLGLSGKVIYVRRASAANEQVVRDLRRLTEEDLDYFSLLIISKAMPNSSSV